MGLEREATRDFKGFAYIKGNDKPYILFGTSEEYIISRLQNFNRARTQEQKYITVNIGSLVDQDSTQVRYDNYKKFEVSSGRDISPTYLSLPSLPREEFKQLTNKLKEEGAKYNPHKRRWYVFPDETERFAAYLPQSNKNTMEVIDIKQELQEAMQEVEEGTAEHKLTEKEKYNIDAIDIQYIVTLEDKRQIALSAGDIPSEYKDKTFRDFFQGLDIALDNVLSKREQPEITEGEYILDVSKEIDINECTVYFSDGRDPMTLYGDQFGVSFSSLDKAAAQELVDNYLLNQADPYQIEDQLEYVLGRPITAYAFDSVNQQFYKIEGTVFEHNDTEVMLRFTEDKICDNVPQEYMSYSKDNLYSAAQKKWIEEALKVEGVNDWDIQFMLHGSYKSAQLEAMAEGLKDGLPWQWVMEYADEKLPAWKMDLYRIGMQHGIAPVRLREIDVQSQDWISGRNMINDAIKEHRKELALRVTEAGFKPTPEIVKKLEHIDHLTGRENTIKDVCVAFKQQTYRENPKLDRLVNELGRAFQMQEMAKIPIQ